MEKKEVMIGLDVNREKESLAKTSAQGQWAFF
jgi:hypothetical protein